MHCASCIPGNDASFLIEYTDDDGQKDDLVIWSPQAAMIDTLATRFIELQKTWSAHVKDRVARRQSFKPRRYVAATHHPSRQQQQQQQQHTKHCSLRMANLLPFFLQRWEWWWREGVVVGVCSGDA